MVANPNSDFGTGTVPGGTSFAAPHVTGLVAQYLEALPNATPAQVETAIRDSATIGVVNFEGPLTPNRFLYTQWARVYRAAISGPRPVLSAGTYTYRVSVTPSNPMLHYSWTMTFYCAPFGAQCGSQSASGVNMTSRSISIADNISQLNINVVVRKVAAGHAYASELYQVNGPNHCFSPCQQ